jgi:hypothetical protein
MAIRTAYFVFKMDVKFPALLHAWIKMTGIAELQVLKGGYLLRIAYRSCAWLLQMPLPVGVAVFTAYW